MAGLPGNIKMTLQTLQRVTCEGKRMERCNSQNDKLSQKSSSLYTQTQADYIYKRCYIDKQGNYIDPKTTWDDLLKYYSHFLMLLSVGEGTRRMAQPVSVKAAKRIKSEDRHQENLRQVTNLQSKDLATKEEKRKEANREHNRDLEAEYLKQTHSRKYRS